ncbi:hypothetical protein BaRGS_00014787, partial [Batillaria attramentaria]
MYDTCVASPWSASSVSVMGGDVSGEGDVVGGVRGVTRADQYSVRERSDGRLRDPHSETCNDDDRAVRGNNNKARLKFLHWNVGGLLQRLNEPGFVEYVSRFDIICLVETFVKDFQSTLFPFHSTFVKPSTDLGRQGRDSGGVVCMIRSEVMPFVRNISVGGYRNFLSFIFYKRLLDSPSDVLFVCAYVPPECSRFYSVFDIDNGIELLEDYLTDCMQTTGVMPILLCGDLNSRTSSICPEYYDESDLLDGVSSSDDVQFKRQSEDSTLNTYGKNLLNMCSSFGLCIMNGVDERIDCQHLPLMLDIESPGNPMQTSIDEVESVEPFEKLDILEKDANLEQCIGDDVVDDEWHADNTVLDRPIFREKVILALRAANKGAAEESSSSNMGNMQMFDRYRGMDIQLLNQLEVRHICDLMVEQKKVKYGERASGYSKAAVWQYFHIELDEKRGCEFFSDWKDNNYASDNIQYDWSQECNTAELDLNGEPLLSSIPVDWNRYKEWDLIQLTQNYMRVLIELVRGGTSGVLIHCISGWDRTPLFVSLLRLSLWADGVVHKSLEATDILYLTLAYDWYLFGHCLTDRVSKGQEVMYFCFKMLHHISGQEFSVGKERDHEETVADQASDQTRNT